MSNEQATDPPGGKGVDEAPNPSEDPDTDVNEVGPDGTEYDEEATREAHRKMTGGDEEHDR